MCSISTNLAPLLVEEGDSLRTRLQNLQS
jgi:hypothetical protein